MRLKSWVYTPAATSANGYANDVTGASWPLTVTTAGDGLAHKTTILNNTANDHSAKTVLITGTDADGNVQTETLAMPGASVTSTGVKYFKTVTTIVPSATIGADTMDLGWSAVAIGPTIPIDWRSTSGASWSVVVTGTINVTVQEAYQDVWAQTAPASGLAWYSITALTSKTANTQGTGTVFATAGRVLINSVTASATVTLVMAQSQVLF